MTTLELPVKSVELVLDIHDTCDRCGPGVQAFVAVRLKSQNELTFCGHCYTVNELAIATTAIMVLDKRQLAGHSPSSGSVYTG